MVQDPRPQETRRGVLGDRGGGRGAGGVSAELRAGMLDGAPGANLPADRSAFLPAHLETFRRSSKRRSSGDFDVRGGRRGGGHFRALEPCPA